MSEKKEELDMSLFDMETDLELNLNPDVSDYVEETDESDKPNENEDVDETVEESTDDENNENNLNEDESSEEVVEEEDQEEEESSDNENDSPNLYSSFANVLNEQGLLPSLDLQNKKIESLDDLTEALKGEIQSQAKQYILEKVGEDGYDALEKGISLAEYQQHQDNIETIDSIDESQLSENLELAKRIILRDYINQGIDQKRAERLLKKTIDLGEDSILEDAKDSLSSLKEFEQKRLQALAEQREQERKNLIKQQEKIDNDLKNSIYNKKEFIKGIPVTKAIQDKVYNSITKIVNKTEDGVAENKLMKDRRENPIEFDSKLYYLYEITNGFNDFSTLVNKSKTSASKQLEEQLRKTKFESGSKPAYLDDPESYGGIGSELVI